MATFVEICRALPSHEVALKKAFNVASRCHSGQIRATPDGTEPYFNHPVRVARTAFDVSRACDFSDEKTADVVCAALLHDTIEDCSKVLASMVTSPGVGNSDRKAAGMYLVTEFGPSVLSIVNAVTNPEHSPGISKEESRLLYIDHLANSIFSSASDSEAVTVVKLSDLLDNAGKVHLLPKGARRDHLTAKYINAVNIIHEAVLTWLPEEGKQFLEPFDVLFPEEKHLQQY